MLLYKSDLKNFKRIFCCHNSVSTGLIYSSVIFIFVYQNQYILKKPTILITNDDGALAKGLHSLIEVMQELGNVVVVAPDSPQSGMAHAITMGTPLRLEEIKINGAIKAYQCSGTPVDCVKLAICTVLHEKPDLCVSGINHGSNSSINVIYSGTMSAAIEGAIEGIPSIGFSLSDHNANADFTAAQKYAKMISQNVLEHKLPKGTLLNVNIPSVNFKDIKGVRVCRQALAKWEDEFEIRLDPNHKKYYWMKGNFTIQDKGKDTDEYALANNYVSIVPIHFDLTAHHTIPYLNKWNYENKI